MIRRIALMLSAVLAPSMLPSANARAQDVPGIEICTVEKTMERRTSCLQSNVDFLQKTIAKSLQQQKQLAQIKKEAIELEAKLDMLKTVLPLERETDLLFRSVQQQATTSALRIIRVAPRPTIDHEVYTEWPIDMEVVGTYHNVGSFLDKIRQLPRIVNITNLNLAARASEGEQAFTSSVGATYVATTFVYKEEGIASTAPPPKPVK